MKHRSQSATEYIFLLAMVLVLLTIVVTITMKFMRQTTQQVSKYITKMRRDVFENL